MFETTNQYIMWICFGDMGYDLMIFLVTIST
jgi:hypothetical protein